MKDVTKQTEQFTIPKRWSWLTAITVSIECDPLAPTGVKLGLAVKSAFATDAVLRDAVLRGAVLTDAVLTDEKIERLLATVERLNAPYTFYGFQMAAGGVKISAGCRFFTCAEFRAHVASKYPDTDKARETLRIIDFIEGRASDLGVALERETAVAA